MPGGPTTSIIISLQGDRLDPAAAEDTSNYIVTFLGADETLGTADDRMLSVAEAVYAPGANVGINSGTERPENIRQTVTLLFDEALPAGDFRIQVSPNVQAAAFSEEELGLLTPRAGFTGHPVVSQNDGVLEGSDLTVRDLVMESVGLGDFSIFDEGTRFLEQFKDDLIAVLDAFLTENGDSPAATQALIDQVLARFTPALAGPDGNLVPMLVIVLDPISFELEEFDMPIVEYDTATDEYTEAIDDGFVDVSGNVEVVVLPQPSGTYMLNVSNVSTASKGLVVSYTSSTTPQVTNLTSCLQSGQTSYTIDTTSGGSC
jgi:hypothetical protein